MDTENSGEIVLPQYFQCPESPLAFVTVAGDATQQYDRVEQGAIGIFF